MCDLFTFLLISFFCIYVGMLFAYQTTAIITTTISSSSRLSFSYVRSWSMCVSITTLLQLPAAVYFPLYIHFYYYFASPWGRSRIGIPCYRVFPFVYIVFIHLCVFLFEGNCSRKSSRLPGLWTIWLREEIIHSFYYPVTGTGNGSKHDYWLQSVRNIVIKTSGA